MININKLNFKKKVILLTVAILGGALFPTISDAASSKYNHNHTGYTCFKMSSYMSASEVSKLAKQANSIGSATELAAALGGAYKGWIAPLAFVYGKNVKAQMKPFTDASKAGKGIEYSYINHTSVYTTDSYNTNEAFKIK
ncbi:hypothetical protein [Gottfriedia acidiceleris]|uniref:hypothetical protein n=1 Tax=Gottfriedia acidiceleris TaxID=371036 RepID=UPI00101D5EE6|nr:hypothetical protein [Gottfriedia acidiceleris]